MKMAVPRQNAFCVFLKNLIDTLQFFRAARDHLLRNYQENKLKLDGGDLAEKNSLTIVKRVAAECFLN